MSFLRHTLIRSSLGRLKSYPSLTTSRVDIVCSINQARQYASKNKGNNREKRDKEKAFSPLEEAGKKAFKHATATDNLIPGSQRILAGEEYGKAEGKMQAIVEKYRKEVASLETRAVGRVTPDMLHPVRVMLPHNQGADGKGVRLDELATVGVKEGTSLLITVFEEHTLKLVEQAVYDANIPGLVPQRVDARTIKIPIPKPTVEARLALYTTAQRHAEDARVHLRKQHQASVKKGAYKKHAPELEEFQQLTDKHVSQVDKILAEFKKSTGAK